ncbi:unnamed protein product, partial [Candidula unifasciata]
MSHQLPEGGSPLRDKRRQSDAKWRASVATCYDVLKYVVPNVKHMSKKKISKALILQECEKHIQDLEDTISYLFHVECRNQGRIALWKEGDCWSQCTVEKLHEDFTEKQRKVFHVSAHGRRCYNLLQDIKEEVFDMRADSKQITFISEDSLNLMNNSEDASSLTLINNSEHVSLNPMSNLEDVNDSMMGTHTEVPTMETPVKTTQIKRPRLSSDSSDIDFLNGCGVTDIKKVGCVPELNVCTDNSYGCDSMFSQCYSSDSVGSRVSTLTVAASLMHSDTSDIKVETEDSSPYINNDPMLSSLNTPNFDADMSLFLSTTSDGVTKRPPKFGSARKKLNFNSPSYSGWPHTSPGLVHPDRAVPAFPVLTGFTPVKLPDELTRISEASSEYLTSPWKPVNSPFNCRTMAQSYISSSTLVDLEDNLFCMETLDESDFEDSFSSEMSLVPDEPSNRMKPPCRRRLEG